MVRFVDLKNGNTFDGSYPYIFWLEGEQSINLIYSQPICFISNTKDIDINLEKNDIFSLVDPSKLINAQLESIYGFEYHNINTLKVNSLTSIGTPYKNCYIHMIYIIASASQAGEYIVNLSIDNDTYKIGGDFYGENEILYVNLSNNGVEIPEVVQKALYNVNIHEEKRDNITLNRKWKELLSNFWDVIANKGSYKSLFNSLNWFEYGNKIKLCEVWKNIDTNKYFTKEIQQLLSENFYNSLNGFVKTTYSAIYYALEEPMIKDGKMILDDEKNPTLQYVSSKWSTQDLALKLCLLGNFYETYFMPIHLDLIHSTIEDVVYTNTFKVRQGTTCERTDYIYNYEDIQCNIEDGAIYKLNKVECFVGPETLFGLSYPELQETGVMIGVQTKDVNELNTNEDWQQYASQMYNEIGAVVDLNFQIPLSTEDKIKRIVMVYKTFINNEWVYKTFFEHRILDKDINFSLFCPVEGEYDVRLQFDSLDGKVYTKRIKFNVIDTNSIAMNVYKIYNLQTLDDSKIGQVCQINDYISSRRPTPSDHQFPVQYIPAKMDNLAHSQFKWRGVCLNHLLILRGNLEDLSSINQSQLNIWKTYYFLLTRHVGEGEDYKCYTICISKTFGFHYSNNVNVNIIYKQIKYLIYREDYIFVPEFHKLVPLDNERLGRKEEIGYYTVTDNDALCVIPELSYGKYIAEYDWEFINASKPFQKPIQLNYIKEPFITGEKSPLEPGYYNIRFHYRLTNEDKINTIELNSAFKKV